MTFHIGTDPHGMVHSVVGTTAKETDITVLAQVLHGADKVLFGDQAHWSQADRAWCAAHGVRYRMNRRGANAHPLTERQKKINRSRSRTRARAANIPSAWSNICGGL